MATTTQVEAPAADGATLSAHEGFRPYVLRQLRDIPGLACQHCFGGVALYQYGVPFAIIDDQQLYFKTDAHTVGAYQRQDMPAYPAETTDGLESFFRVPNQVVQDPPRLTRWARRALIVANRQLDQ